MTKKILVSKERIKVMMFKRNFEANRPLYDELVNLLSDTDLKPTDRDLVPNLVNLIVSDMRKTLPGVDDMEIVRMRGKSNLVSRVNQIVTTLEHINLYSTPGALEEHVENELYIYCTDPEQIEWIERIKTLINVSENFFGNTKAHIENEYTEYGFRWGYGQEGYEFNLNTLADGIRQAKARVERMNKPRNAA